MLEGKKIVLGITGSIAAYKACLIIRNLIRKGAEVQVVITPAGKEFITPITLSTLTRKPVINEFFNHRDGTWHSHVDLGLWADAMLIAPATASTIGKMANGIADNMLITTYLSMKAPVFVAPAMDLDMYAHESTQKNLRTLQSYGNHIIEPGSGFLASQLEGKGRMEEPERIVEILESYFYTKRNELKEKEILITAGPTFEKIDPVRFIGNYSSGKMGIALAEECARRGAKVHLVCGPIAYKAAHPNIIQTNVENAEEMYRSAIHIFPSCQAGILCAAVADYTPEHIADNKIKRQGDLQITLKPTKDIAQALGQQKTDRQVLVGFALETQDEETNAKAKLQKKNLDFIVLNSLNDKGAGFRHETNKVTIISPEEEKQFPLKSKKEVATDIINKLTEILK